MTIEWSYDNVEGPTYPIIPRLPQRTRRIEASFIPDSNPSTEILEVSTIHKDDQEIERELLREIERKRGRRGGKDGEDGWWVEREYSILSVPKRKVLFVFGGEGKAR